MKKCASKECDQLNPQPLINFWKNKSTKDGLSIHCKVCNKKYIKKTGKVRGLLCDHCNWLVGHSKESKEILNSAIEYLKEFS